MRGCYWKMMDGGLILRLRLRFYVLKMKDDLKISFVDVAGKVCGYIKRKARHSETSWWNDHVVVAVNRDVVLFKIWKTNCDEGNQR